MELSQVHFTVVFYHFVPLCTPALYHFVLPSCSLEPRKAEAHLPSP